MFFSTRALKIPKVPRRRKSALDTRQRGSFASREGMKNLRQVA
jgi:hypothetical protein